DRPLALATDRNRFPSALHVIERGGLNGGGAGFHCTFLGLPNAYTATAACSLRALPPRRRVVYFNASPLIPAAATPVHGYSARSYSAHPRQDPLGPVAPRRSPCGPYR